MQRAYKVLPTVEGEPPAVQRVAYPDGTPIDAVAERMGWLLDIPQGAAIYNETGELETPAPVPQGKAKSKPAKESDTE